jgi:hypothetical protein
VRTKFGHLFLAWYSTLGKTVTLSKQVKAPLKQCR